MQAEVTGWEDAGLEHLMVNRNAGPLRRDGAREAGQEWQTPCQPFLWPPTAGLTVEWQCDLEDIQLSVSGHLRTRVQTILPSACRLLKASWGHASMVCAGKQLHMSRPGWHSLLALDCPQLAAVPPWP